MIFKEFIQHNKKVLFLDYPEKCPECHEKILPNFIIHKYDIHNLDRGYAFLQCPSPSCQICFSALYEAKGNSNPVNMAFKKIERGSVVEEEFSEIVEEISPSFIQIYNESYHSEQSDLLEISGVGYRKALEFLIKDYLISINPNKEEDIKKKFLGRCISENLQNDNIQKVAKRAAWLGNDETHYVRKWKNKDLSDLKSLIKLTLNWIEMEIITNRIETEMPDSNTTK